MKVKAIVVRLDSPTGSKEDYIYSENGFCREIQIIENGTIVHKSGANHPECAFGTLYNGFVFYTPSYRDEVYVMVNDKIDFL